MEGGQAGVCEEGAVGRGEVCQVGAVLGQGGHQGVTAGTYDSGSIRLVASKQNQDRFAAKSQEFEH